MAGCSATAPHTCVRGHQGHRQLLTFQDVSPLQLLHGRSLAQPSAEKHQNYILHHGGRLRIPPVSAGSQGAGVPLKITPQQLQEEGVLCWPPLPGRSSQDSLWEGGPPLSQGSGGGSAGNPSPRAAPHVRIHVQPGRLEGLGPHVCAAQRPAQGRQPAWRREGRRAWASSSGAADRAWIRDTRQAPGGSGCSCR